MPESSDPVLGLDVGGVIIDRANDDTDTSFFGDHYLQTTAVAGVFEAVRRLVDERFGDRVHVISKCGAVVERKTREWLAHHGFFERTGVSEANLHFVRRRRDKGPVCTRLGIEHFVDDHVAVLAALDTVPHRYLFTGGGTPVPDEIPAWVVHVTGWDSALDELLG